VHICTAGCRPLLRALRFAQHNNMFQQADCNHSLVFILWQKPHSICHPLLSCSKHCLCDVHVCRASKMAMSIIMTCKNIAYAISHVRVRFWIPSWGACQPWKHFQDLLVLKSFLINWLLVRLAHLCTQCTDHPCSNCSNHIPGSSLHCLHSKYLCRTSVLLFSKKGD
jgi:hypothetical protein